MNTVSYMFWGFAAAFVLVAAYVGRLAMRVRALEERRAQLEEQGSDES